MELLQRAARELIISILVGAGPVIIFTIAPEAGDLSQLLHSSLSSASVIYMYAAFLAAYILISAIDRYMWITANRLHGFVRFCRVVLHHAGGSILGAFRVAGGVFVALLVGGGAVDPELAAPVARWFLGAASVGVLCTTLIISLFQDVLDNKLGRV